jgi:RNA polymerase sigma-70 factor (ECF subfamily)
VPAHARTRIEPYLDRLFGYAMSLTRQRESAQDLLHEAVVRVLAARGVPDDERAYRAWLFRIVHNLFIDSLRRHRHAAQTAAQDPEPALDWPLLHQQEQTLINVLTVRAALTRLSLAHREILALVDIAGFTYAEVAAQLHIPLGTVMSRISRARQALLAAIQHGAVTTTATRAARREEG